MPACIIPVGPEFKDPEGFGNSPPEILSPDPAFGATTTATPTTPKTFSITVFDLNADDFLSVRWFVDGMLGPETKHMPSLAMPHAAPQEIGCQQSMDLNLNQHLVKAAVADRDFDNNNPNDKLAIKDPVFGKVTQITWTLNLTCPMGTPSP